MNILILGNGGREHTLAWKISQSKLCDQLFIAPGNAGTLFCGVNVPIQLNEFEKIKTFCLTNKIELLIVGPEGPLVDGITDIFRSPETSHIGIIGPSANAAQLEGSKAFAKKFMQKYNIPTAAYLEVTSANLKQGYAFLDSLNAPYVLKADGLAAGKGVLIIDDISEAKNQLEEMLSGKFGKASETVVIEEYLSGSEFSVFALTDGKEYILLPEAKDYKRIGEGDSGLNTGGMGAVSPVPFVDKFLWEKVINDIVIPTINGISAEKMDYTGFVFFGLINVKGNPYVIEYNCRLGDPETEVIIPRIKSDLVNLLSSAVNKELKGESIIISDDSAATVMLVSAGYPGEFQKNKEISGTENIRNSLIFHAGTLSVDDKILTNGGRVIAITTLSQDFTRAVQISLNNADEIKFEGKYYRRDIGFDL